MDLGTAAICSIMHNGASWFGWLAGKLPNARQPAHGIGCCVWRLAYTAAATVVVCTLVATGVVPTVAAPYS